MKVELGCGANHDPAYFGIDISALPGVDLIWDLEQVPLPIEDMSVEEIFCSHLFEHINNFIALMNDCHRILQPQGHLIAIVPQVADSLGNWHASAFQDPTHVRFFVPASWAYFMAGHELYRFGETYGIKPWDLVQYHDEGWQATIVLRKPAVRGA
jgi:hypothetical protein